MLVRTIFDQAAATAVAEQVGKVTDSLADKLPAAAEHLDQAGRADRRGLSLTPLRRT